MKSITVPIGKIKSNPNNPRIIKDDKYKKLVKSIQEFPEMLKIRPIVVNDDMIVLGGNMRLKACKEAGLKELPIIKASELTEEQQKEFIIKDNVGYGEWDYDMLGNEWDSEQLEEWGMDTIPVINTEKAEEDDYEVGDVGETKTTIVEGDIFEIQGNGLTHKLLCGSSTRIESMETLFAGGGKKANMIFMDPPYLMDFQGAMHGNGDKCDRHDGIINDNLSVDEGDQFLRDFLSLVPLYCKGAWYISFYRLGIDRMFSALSDVGMKWRNLIVWKKDHKNLSNSDYQSIYEPIFYGFSDDYVPIVYGWNVEHQYFGKKGVQNDVWDTIAPRLPSVWEIERTKKNDLHPTMKPVELVGQCINNSSRKGEIVLDMFMGSGTTLIASHQLGRNCYGIELDPKYCKIILERIYNLDSEIKITKNGKKYTV